MKIITKKVTTIFLKNAVECIKNQRENYLIFDIETTGLNHKNSSVILIGTMYEKDSKTYIRQFFCEHPKEEKYMLKEFINFSEKFSHFISFNGDSFDIPFLNSRLKYNNIEKKFDKSMNLDLIKIAKNLAKLSLVENYKLKTIEKFLGINRDDLITGKESIDLYFQFVRSKSESIMNKILLHNFDDIKNLSDLIILTRDHWQKEISSYSPICFLKNDKRYYFRSENCKIKNDFLNIKIFSRDFLDNSELYYSNGGFFKFCDNYIEIKLPTFCIKNSIGTYTFFDTDSINIDIAPFNTLTLEDKKILIVAVDKKINYENIHSFLKKFII